MATNVNKYLQMNQTSALYNPWRVDVTLKKPQPN